MADTNFERAQGETWRITLSLEDSNCKPQQLATAAYVPSVFFSGLATKTGQTDIPIRFQYYPAETKTWGRGSNSETEVGVYRFYAYIPSDEVGSCSIGGHNNRASCEAAANGEWIVDPVDSELTTAKMEAGVWKYVIRMSDAANPSNLESSKNILKGNITILTSVVDISAGAGFTFAAPVLPQPTA